MKGREEQENLEEENDQYLVNDDGVEDQNFSEGMQNPSYLKLQIELKQVRDEFKQHLKSIKLSDEATNSLMIIVQGVVNVNTLMSSFNRVQCTEMTRKKMEPVVMELTFHRDNYFSKDVSEEKISDLINTMTNLIFSTYLRALDGSFFKTINKSFGGKETTQAKKPSLFGGLIRR